MVAQFEVLNAAMLLVWISSVTPAPVRLAANAYAERLFDAIDALELSKP
jgi:hypothetical protein